MIEVMLSTGSIHTYGIARVFKLAAQAGYDGLELMIDDRWDTRQASYLRHLMAHHDLPVSSVHSPLQMPISGWPNSEVARIERSLALAEELGSRVLNVHLPLRIRDLAVTIARHTWRVPIPGPTADQRDYQGWLTEDGLPTLQAKTDVDIVVENLPMRTLLGRRFSPAALNTWEELCAFPRLCLDTTHCGTTGSNLLAVQSQLTNRLSHVHLSDYAYTHEHLSLGHGSLPLDQFLHTLAAGNYDGSVVVELAPRTLPVHDEAELARELRRNLMFCRHHLGQESGDPQPS